MTGRSPALREQLATELRAVAAHRNQHLTQLQSHAAIALVGASYQAFGFGIFGPLGRQLLARHLESLAGLAISLSSSWLEAVAFSLLEDLNVLQVVTGEPDWSLVDRGLAFDIWQRVFCSDKQENEFLGLDIVEPQDLVSLRHHAAEALRILRSEFEGQLSSGRRISDVLPVDWHSALSDTFAQVSGLAESNPLRLLLWRIEGFSQIRETRHEMKFVVREPTAMSPAGSAAQPLVAALAWLLTALSPVSRALGDGPATEPPLSVPEIAEMLVAEGRRGSFASVGISPPVLDTREQGGAEQDGAVQGGAVRSRGKGRRGTQRGHRAAPSDSASGHHQGARLTDALQAGRDLGLIFEVVPKPGKECYGLTAAGLRIIAPFEGLLVEWLSEHPLVPAGGSSCTTATAKKHSKGSRVLGKVS